MIGQVFGRLTILERRGSNDNRQPVYLARCTCGVEKEYLLYKLKAGNTKSCGCWNIESISKRNTKKIKDITGEVFGRLTVLSMTNSDKYRRKRWLCRCTCGKEVEASGNQLRFGNVVSCGCLHKEIMQSYGALGLIPGNRRGK